MGRSIFEGVNYASGSSGILDVTGTYFVSHIKSISHEYFIMSIDHQLALLILEDRKSPIKQAGQIL